ncbi:MAG TPA: ABC transporter ATP-binding protein [Planctomycetota bacterium]|nr:ABC transporter ATP-binding protein [Planctomycetota bacterium]
MSKANGGQPLVQICDLHTYFYVEGGPAKAVEGLDLEIHRGKTLGLVGESGCGKSATALSIMRLIPSPPGRIARGRITFDGRNLLDLPEAEMRQVRGRDITMIFQEPMTSLNPVFTIGYQIAETVLLHEHVTKKQALGRAIEMLGRVKIPSPEQRVNDYPHHLSGGMRQRAMIAMALACNPKLLIADEPTTALDVTIQAQIMELFDEISKGTDMSMLLVTHNLGLVAQSADDVAVMYAGHVMEQSPTELLFDNPLHPYTRGLLESVPKTTGNVKRLHVIPGSVPDPAHKPPGCPFHPRCPRAIDVCRKEMPPAIEPQPGHTVRCWAVSGPPSGDCPVIG